MIEQIVRPLQRSAAGLISLLVLSAGVVLRDATPQQFGHPRQMGLPATQFVMPDTNRPRLVLQNSLVAFVVPDSTVPLVTFTAFVRAGRGDDRADGAAEMLELMLATRGPCWMAPGRFDETLDELAADFRVEMSAEMTEITLNVAAEDADQGLRVFSGIMRETCLDPDGLDSFRRRVQSGPVSSLAAGESGPVLPDGSLDVAVRLFRDLLYRDHVYRVGVDPAQAAALQLEDVERFYREYFTPANVVLAVSGMFPLREMALSIDQRFADWQERRPPTFRRAPNLDAPEPGAATHFTTDKLQTWIVIGHDLRAMEPRQFAALEVMNYVLGGGHFDTRLFRETRDKRGLTNDASGFLEPGLRGPGMYTFRTYGRPEVAGQLIDIILQEVRRMQLEPVTDEELLVAKGALADGAFAMRFENGHATARTFAAEWAKYLTFDHLAQYQEWIRDVSVDDVRRAAERHLHPERLRIVTLGPTPPRT